MNLIAAWDALKSKANDDLQLVEHSSWFGSRMGILLGFAALAVAAFLGHELLSDANMQRLTYVAIAYILGNAYTRGKQIEANGAILKDVNQAKASAPTSP